MKKILIPYVSYGSGHKTIAQYIAAHLEKSGHYEIKVVDLADYMGKTGTKTIEIFDYVFNHRMDGVFSFLYRISNNGFINRNYYLFLKKAILNKEIRKLYVDYNPDIVLATHFYGNAIAAILKRKKLINPKIVTMVTDYKLHKMWLAGYDKEELFIVANEIVKRQLVASKINPKNVYAYGLPCDTKKIFDMLPKKEIYAKYDLDPDKEYILFFGGGSTGCPVFVKYLKKLLDIPMKQHIIFVCGKGEEMYKKVNKIAKNDKRVHAFGFVNNVYELMEISNIVINKPGAALITECLEMRKYMILIPGMGGQESYNAKFVKKNQYGTFARNAWALKRKVKKYAKDPEKFLSKYNRKNKNNESLKHIANLISKL